MFKIILLEITTLVVGLGGWIVLVAGTNTTIGRIASALYIVGAFFAGLNVSHNTHTWNPLLVGILTAVVALISSGIVIGIANGAELEERMYRETNAWGEAEGLW